MDQKINTTISADNKQFISAIQQATQVANAMVDKLNDIGDNASDAASRIDDAAGSIEHAADAISRAGDAAESTKPSLEGLAQGIAKAGNLGQALSNVTGELLKGTTLTAGEIGIVAKGVESLFQIALDQVRKNIQAQKDLAETLDRNAHSLSEVADANEEARKAANGYMEELSNLAGVEELSNQQKLKQAQLLELLRQRYAGLADELIAAGSDARKLDEVMAKKLEADKDRRVAELDTIIKQYRQSIDAQRELSDDNDSFIVKIATGGRSYNESLAAAEKAASLQDEQRKYIAERYALIKSTPGEDYLAQRKASRDDAREEEISRLLAEDQDKNLSAFDKQRRALSKKLEPLLKDKEITEEQRSALMALKAREEERINEAEILAIQKEEAAEQAKMEAEAAKERAAAEQYAKQRLAVETKIKDLLDEQKKRRLSQYDQKRLDVEKKYLALMDEAETTDDLNGLNAWKKGELQNIAEEEAKAAEEAAQDALKEKQKALEQAEKEAIASSERVANAEKRLTDAKLNYEKQQQEKQFREARERQNRQIQSLQGKIKSYDRQLASFGFSLGEGRMKRHTSAAERNETRRNLKLDESISEKQAARARGENVHFTNREWRRIREAEKIRDKKEQAEEKIEAIKAAQASQDAAKAAQEAAARQADAGKKMEEAAAELKKCKDEQAKANTLQTEAAKAFQEAADSLNPKDGKAKQTATPEGTVPVVGTVEGAATTAPHQVGKVAKSAVIQGNLPAAPGMTPTGNDILKPLDTIIGLLQKLQSNVYIAR